MKNTKFVKLLISFFAFGAIAGSSFVGSKKISETVAANPVTDKNAVYDSIVWDNVIYDDANLFIPTGAFDPCLAGQAPQEGYAVLAFFKYSDGSDSTDLTLGELCNNATPETMAASNFADDACAAKIKVNGVSINEVEGAGLYIYPFNGLLFYLPHDSLDFSKFTLPTITTSENINLGLIDIEPFALEFRGALGVAGGWKVAKNKDLMPVAPYCGIAGGWNNTGSTATTKNTILTFGTPEVDYLKDDHTPDGANLVAAHTDCGTMISVNGIQLKDIPGATVSYMHGNCYVYVDLPISCLSPQNGYKVTTFHIEPNCEFHDVLLSEVTLYMFNNEWQETCPAYPDDEEYIDALNLSDCVNKTNITLDENHQRVSGEFANVSSKFAFYIDYLLNTEEDSFMMYLFGTNGQNGLRFVAKQNTITIYDSTVGSVVLGTANLAMLTYGDWNALLIYGEYHNGALEVRVAIDDITYIQASIFVENKDNIGKKVDFYLGGGSVSIRNAVYGTDIKRPTIIYFGKKVYGVLENEPAIDFSSRVTAFDAKDGDLTEKVNCTWENGALTNNLINAGEWTVTLSVEDAAKNRTEVKVKVVCRNNLDVFVSFDGKNTTKYKIGDSIAKPANPVSENEDEVFVGWYYGDILWDFENDYVTQDMNLISKFKSTVVEYQVQVNIIGLDNFGYTLYFVEGTFVNVEIFERDGYTMVAKIDGEEVDSFRVTQNITLTLEYTGGTHDEPVEKGCKNSLVMSGALISATSGLALALLGLKKKEDK